jgi:integrase
MLSEAIDRHIELYRSVGFKYRVQAYMLRSFAAFAESRSELFIRTDTVLEWAASAPSVRQRCDRLLTIRRLACALKAEDERHEAPPSDVFGRAPRRHRTCHIFTQGEINILLRSTAQLGPRRSIRPVTYIALLSLIAATGLRISEALRLQISDITDEGLLIRETKFQKSRLVPLHASARQGLLQYLAVRKRVRASSSNVFVSRHGTALPYSNYKERRLPNRFMWPDVFHARCCQVTN